MIKERLFDGKYKALFLNISDSFPLLDTKINLPVDIACITFNKLNDVSNNKAFVSIPE